MFALICLQQTYFILLDFKMSFKITRILWHIYKNIAYFQLILFSGSLCVPIKSKLSAVLEQAFAWLIIMSC